MNRSSRRTIVGRVTAACMLTAGLVGVSTVAANAASVSSAVTAPAYRGPGHGSGHSWSHGGHGGHYGGHGYYGGSGNYGNGDLYGDEDGWVDDADYYNNGYDGGCSYGSYDPDC